MGQWKDNLPTSSINNNMENKFEPRYDEFGTVFESSSKLRKITTEELQELLDTSTSLSNVIDKLGICVKPNYLQMLRTIIESRKLDLTKMKLNREISTTVNRRKYDIDSIFCENSKYSRQKLKQYLITNKLIEYKCSECGIIDEYNNKPLVLQLDHINGVNNDNRLINIRFICPMCHSQTHTYAGRNTKRTKKVHKCIECGNEISSTALRCKICTNSPYTNKPRKLNISKDELSKLISQMPMTSIGKLYGVSDNAIRKRCKAYGISKNM